MRRVVFLCVCLLGTIPGWADAHGPAFGYSTTTLGSGNSSIENVMMWRGGVAMVGPRFSYGVTENFQFSVSAPFHVNHGEHPVGRFTAMMPGEPAAEALVAWRFHHTLTGVGTRNESTLYLGVSGTTQTLPRRRWATSESPTGLLCWLRRLVTFREVITFGQAEDINTTAIGQTVRTIKVTRC